MQYIVLAHLFKSTVIHVTSLINLAQCQPIFILILNVAVLTEKQLIPFLSSLVLPDGDQPHNLPHPMKVC
jgi:hypothetical protein